MGIVERFGEAIEGKYNYVTRGLPLFIGQKAPDFNLVTLNPDTGEPETVNLYAMKNMVKVLGSFNATFTGTCNQEGQDLSGLCDLSGLAIKRNATSGIYTALISTDQPYAQAAWQEKYGITIPVLSAAHEDPNDVNSFLIAYGVGIRRTEPETVPFNFPQRADWVIDQNNRIRGVRYHKRQDEQPDLNPPFELALSLVH